MKGIKKPLGSKAQIKCEKERERRIATAIFLAIILLAAAFSAYFGYIILSSSPDLSLIEPTRQFKPENPNPELKAAIVDQLSLTLPNQTFTETTASTLTTAGYTVDYFSGESVTVEFYRNLPTHGYKILILRVHSLTDTFQGKQMVGFFTSELYSTTQYVQEQLTDQIGCLTYYPGDQTKYFGISQEFVKSSMNGRFNDTLVVMMGCNGLNNTQMAEAFVERSQGLRGLERGSFSRAH